MAEATQAGARGPNPGSLLATKLHVPRVKPGFVVRPRLIDQLNDGPDRRNTLVCAPPGFGKTALLAEWAVRRDDPVAWLSLDQADNDPARFWRDLAAAIDRVVPGLIDRVEPTLGSSPASLDCLVTSLVNELSASPTCLAIVLDEYHAVEARSIHDSVQILLEHLPVDVRLIILSRADPPLALARLRVDGQLVELRAADLRFTRAEAAELLAAALGATLPDSATAALTDRTEGWAAGLQLAALSLHDRSDVDVFVTTFSGSHRYVLDYLTEEVLDRQPAVVRRFLIETSVLTRLSGDLCDAVTGRSDGQAMLEAIERSNLFVIALDDVRGWWRYHHLFADLLRARFQAVDPDRVVAVHRAAAAWCEANDLPDEAVHHAVAAGDTLWAARVIERDANERAAAAEHAAVPLRRFDEPSAEPVPGRSHGIAIPGHVEPLSEREYEVLQLVAAGRPNREIANELFVTVDTVKKHVTHVLGKLGVTNRTAAAALARSLGVIPGRDGDGRDSRSAPRGMTPEDS